MSKELYSKLNGKTKEIFKEAIGHQRNKCKLYELLYNCEELQIDNLHKYSGQFEDIYKLIHIIIDKIDGLGKLCIYDLTAAICRFHNINIDKIYLNGNGPQNAIKKLKIKPKKHTFYGITIDYVEIEDVIRAFDKFDENIKNSKNGDIWVSYLCKWQK